MIHLRGKDMLFIEAHGHVWEKLHGRRFDTDRVIPLENGKVQIGEKVIQFLPPEVRDDVFPIEVLKTYEQLLGFDKVVVLQTPCYGEQYEYINSFMSKEPDRYVTVGIPNPQDKQSYMETAALCLDRYKYKGLKFESPDIPFDMLASENQFVFEEILKRNAYFVIDLGWGDGPYDYPIDDLIEIAKRYPDLTIVLPHLGISKMWDPEETKTLNSLKKTLSILEHNTNVYFDCSGIPMLATKAGQEYPWPVMTDALKVAKQMGAIDRVMWGSDAPTVLVACTYKQHVDAVVNYIDFLSDDEVENLVGKTADKVWFGN
ncbi:amidohydrolase family protein [uncultured Sphaerochaeta sp.]|uniref:amidohydrolase family protein n=1 Tax=uncultured Sphaerochaeta sp. TaxID=886478 RepID=UPI002AA66134|nr:amidohydrolase family protein [uncultured Sphaerochaeta sp.]